MRRLLYVPIIHDDADMGSSGAALARSTARLVGEGLWAIHRQTVEKFWQGVSAYLMSLDPRPLRLYQDGLPADGELGKRIVEEAARRGSKNYQLLLELLQRGAELRKAEDPRLLLEEREIIVHALSGGPVTAQRWAREQVRLTEARDVAIAQAIDSTLKEKEIGVLLIGAAHDVRQHLAPDISVETVMAREKVQAYLSALLAGHHDEMEKLAKDITSDAGPAAIR